VTPLVVHEWDSAQGERLDLVEIQLVILWRGLNQQRFAGELGLIKPAIALSERS
jgi:hypothetical protein